MSAPDYLLQNYKGQMNVGIAQINDTVLVGVLTILVAHLKFQPE
jgi:hypothetical protein